MKKHFTFFIAGWTLFIAALLGWNFASERTHIDEEALIEARAIWEHNLSYRKWVTAMGGVYVRRDKMGPNPYMAGRERDKKTVDGIELTMANPAYMTSQVFEIIRKENDLPIVNRIVSDKPLNPRNTPDEWEMKGLRAFGAGTREVNEVMTLDGQPYMRLFKPMIAVEGCLKCHGQQGYTVGDIRGGISVAIPMRSYYAIEAGRRRTTATVLLPLWALGVAGIGLYFRKSEKTQKSLLEYQKALENSQDMIAVVDRDYRYVLANDAFLRYRNADREQVVGRSVPDVLGGDLFEKVIRKNLDSCFHGEVVQYEMQNRYPVLGERDLLVSYYPVEEAGRVTRVVSAIRDITERKQSEEALRKSEQNLALHVLQTPLGVIEWDLGFKVTKWNPAAERIFGYSAKEVLGAHASLIVPPAVKEHVDRIWSDLLQMKGGHRSTNENVTKDGRTIFCEWYNTPLVDSTGSVVAVASLVQDITERKRAEEALSASERFLENIVEYIPNMIFVKDAETLRFVRFNRAGEELLGYSRDELLGKNDYDFFPRQEADFFTSNDRLVLARNELADIQEETIQTRSKGERTLHTRKIPIRDDTGKAQFLLGISEDITERKRLEEQLRQSQKMEAIGQLAGGVAHDFNNILMAIMGYGNLIQRKLPPNDPLRLNANQLLESAERAAQLTRSLLAFSRKQVMQMEPVSLNEIISRTEKFLRRIVGEDMDLTTALGSDALVLADTSQIEQVLMNLATNARDAMPRGGVLSIATDVLDVKEREVMAHGVEAPGSYVVISVTDTGMGMNEETKQKIFEPFFTTKEMGRGTGLGLAIVYGIVRQHHGAINVYSEAGAGTTFKIYLPVYAGSAERREAGPQPAPIVGGTETILLAEDDQFLRTFLADMLGEFGYRVIAAEDGLDAVGKFAEQADAIQLCILDIIMPRRGGREAYEEISRLRPGVRAIFTSGYPADKVRREGIPEGCEFIQKPAAPERFLRKIRELLDRETGAGMPV